MKVRDYLERGFFEDTTELWFYGNSPREGWSIFGHRLNEKSFEDDSFLRLFGDANILQFNPYVYKGCVVIEINLGFISVKQAEAFEQIADAPAEW